MQLVVTATYPSGSTKNVTAASTGTNYTISNPSIATINAGGLVTTVSSGTVVIQANNDGATAIATVSVAALGGATLCGGLVPVSWFITNHLNPADPLVCIEDPDRDGLTNLEEFQQGTDPNNPDTDGDGLTDGDEVHKYHTNPLLPDTDGDLIPDGVEVQTGTNPLDPKSYDLKKATAVSTVTPPSFTLQPSVSNPVVSVQLNWKVKLIDGKTTLDLTADPRTSYGSSDLNICHFGGQPGLIFSGSAGSCTITISQNTLAVPVQCTVLGNFTPTEVSTLNVPGAVAVDVGGSFAYVATGANGLTVVDVTDRAKLRARGTLAGIGNAQGVRASGQNVFIADSSGFLRIVNAQNPDAPTLVSSVPIPGSPAALALHGTTVAIAAQSGGVSLVNIANPASPSIIASFTVPAPALGVDFDPQSGITAVAMGTSGPQLADISVPASPKLRGILTGGDVRRVLVKLPAALLADAQRSITAVDISNPDKPVLSSSLPPSLGGIPVDIAAFGNIAMTADVTFGRAIPIVNISNPLNPSSVGFWSLLSAGFSSSIAVDISFGYAITPATSTLQIVKAMIQRSAIPMLAMVVCIGYGSCLAQERVQTNPSAVQLRVVTGVPFSATAVTETNHVLADGNRIVHKTTAFIARDSDGRTRRESGEGTVVFIQDPVARVAYVLESHTHTARKIAIANTEADHPSAATNSSIGKARQNSTIQTALGSQVIDGLQVEGTRTSRSIPSGQAGNERSLEVVSEAWYSIEIQTILMNKQTDPRSGEAVYKLTNIQRDEPAQSLFEVPEGYTVREELQPVQSQGSATSRNN